MTLIVATITKENGYLFCDKMHSLDGTEKSPVKATIKLGETTISLESSKIRINAGTKIYKLTENVILGGAGNHKKVVNYLENMRRTELCDIVQETHRYYQDNKSDSPDQLAIISKAFCRTAINAFSINPIEGINSFYNSNFTAMDDSIVTVAIGSGSDIFLAMYSHIRNEIINKYKDSISNNHIQVWEMEFESRIKGMYAEISRYDDAVGSDIECLRL